jgi:hypothetical protein
MSTGKHQDRTHQQLQLFGHEEPAAVVVTPSAFGETHLATRVELRLVSNTTTAQQSKTEDLTAIEARLIGRAKYF